MYRTPASDFDVENKFTGRRKFVNKKIIEKKARMWGFLVHYTQLSESYQGFSSFLLSGSNGDRNEGKCLTSRKFELIGLTSIFFIA